MFSAKFNTRRHNPDASLTCSAVFGHYDTESNDRQTCFESLDAELDVEFLLASLVSLILSCRESYLERERIYWTFLGLVTVLYFYINIQNYKSNSRSGFTRLISRNHQPRAFGGYKINKGFFKGTW